MSAPAQELYSRRYVNYVLLLLFAVAVFNTCDRTILSVLLEDVKREIQLSDRQLGLLVGFAFTTVHLLAGLPLARLADRTSRRTIIAAGLLVWSAMTAAAGLAQTFGQLLVARMGVGIGEAAGSPPSHSLISDYTPPEQRARALSVITIGAVAGLGFGNVFGGWVSELHGWRAAFLAVGLPGVALAVLVRLTVREPPRGYGDRLGGIRAGDAGATGAAGEESFAQVVRFLLGRPSYRYLVLGACCAGVATFGKNFWEPTFLRRVYGMGAGEAGTWYFAIASLPTALGAYLGGALCDRLGRRDVRWYMWLPALANALAVPLSLAFLLWPEEQRVAGVPLAFLWSFAASIAVAFWSPATMAMAQALARPRMRALSAALWTMLFNFIGLGVGPLVVGDLNVRLEPRFGPEAVRYSLALASTAPLAAALFHLLAARHLPRDLARTLGTVPKRTS